MEKPASNGVKLDPSIRFTAQEAASFLLIGESGVGKTTTVAFHFLSENFCLESKIRKFLYFGVNAKDISLLELALSATDIQFEQHGKTELRLLDSFDEEHCVILADDCNADDVKILQRFADDRSRKQECALFSIFHPKAGHKAYRDLLASSTHVLYPDAGKKGFGLFGLQTDMTRAQKDEYSSRLQQVFSYRLPNRFEGTEAPKVINNANNIVVDPPWSKDLYAEAFVIISNDKWFSSRKGFPSIVFAPK